MPRHLQMRQLEAFIAVMDSGTMVQAADTLGVSQPTMSKLISHLEFGTGLRLFDRVRGRLVATAHGIRLYDEVDRAFLGIRQIESAVDAIKREEQCHLSIGLMPALSGRFIQETISSFMAGLPGVKCTIYTQSSREIVDGLLERKIDVGVVSANIKDPRVILESLTPQPLVCIVGPQHPLANLSEITSSDLEGVDFISGIEPDLYTRRALSYVKTSVKSSTVINTVPLTCEFVAAGKGVSLVHPLWVYGMENKLLLKKFIPESMSSFQICQAPDSRKAAMSDIFISQFRETAQQIYALMD